MRLTPGSNLLKTAEQLAQKPNVSFLQGVDIAINIWDADASDDALAIRYDLIDEYKFTYTQAASYPPIIKTFDGIRTFEKTK